MHRRPTLEMSQSTGQPPPTGQPPDRGQWRQDRSRRREGMKMSRLKYQRLPSSAPAAPSPLPVPHRRRRSPASKAGVIRLSADDTLRWSGEDSHKHCGDV
ncbi:hypothetical protein DPEC_G00026760 [Dallia pectoralis]|uniref:Uncharacterized protein n=1 Tax=Dallia pectoralis TaxID=75939 RepID=A0ACC2HI08_DALPE|nr:hypothetical protein DPEC_G00026760 [Dallia pectoralis]